VSSFDSRGAVAIYSKDNNPREITHTDIDEVLKVSRAVSITPDREVMHVVPQVYIVDGHESKEPLDMIAVRLEAKVQVVTASKTTRQNFIKCVTRAGYTVEAIMYKMLAVAEAVMSKDEKELGSIVIDLGAGSTDTLVLYKGAPVFSFSLPVGGNTVTNDLSVVHGLSFETAERIKIESGCCWEKFIDPNRMVLFPGVGGRPPEEVPQYELCKVLQPRMEEIFEIIRDKIADKTQITELSGNIVLTGGGAAMSGLVELVSHVFNTQAVRIGSPGKLGGDELMYRNPEFATAIGLIVSRFSSRHAERAEVKTSSHVEEKKSVLSHIGNFFKEFF
ncbi:MAG: cell division protein FtsA, partial [Spirochaetaceae bacterium]|nr:cell division protein FtsA [Spirochaetaceae bacterium]